VLSSVISTIILLAIVIVPVFLLAGSLVDGLHSLAARLQQGTPIIPPLPETVASWPVIGVYLKKLWELASKDVATILQTFGPQIKAIIPGLLVASAGVSVAVIQWVLSIVIAGVLLGNSAKAGEMARLLANRLFGEKGADFEELACSTVRSVTTGIVGVALIQSLLAAIGFLVAGLPGAGLWSVVFLLAAVLQIGVIVLICAVIYMFVIASSTKAVIFLGWCLVVAFIDNVLKPFLLGRGLAVPMAVVFLGVIGGFVVMGTIGFFVGAVLLSVGYKLALAWLQETSSPTPEIAQSRAA
jgi:predicted PurR-regulated permease PerM